MPIDIILLLMVLFDVDDVVAITIRSVQMADEDVETEEDSNKGTDGDSTSWLP